MLTKEQIDNRAKWVLALTSLRYEQGRTALKYLNAEQKQVFCCLGVGCDIIDPDKWNIGTYNKYGIDGEFIYMPEPIAIKFGLKDWQQKILTRMNDTGASFKHIAETIESWTILETQSA